MPSTSTLTTLTTTSASQSSTSTTTMSPNEAFTHLRTSFHTGITNDVSFRRNQLLLLRKYIQDNEGSLYKALWDDFRRPEYQSFLFGYQVVLKEIDHFLTNLKQLSQPKRMGKLISSPAHNIPTAKGVILIFGPSNFPIMLTIRPLIAALAAGNCIVVKPSEYTPASEQFLVKVIQHLHPDVVQVVTGNAQVAKDLMTHRWDHVMFTGSTVVGKLVMQAAAKQLIPVTLELGGKNPCIVAKDAELDTAAMSIIQGRFINAGQICLAPDYCIVDESIIDKFCVAITCALTKYYGEDLKSSPHYSRMGQRHSERIKDLLSRTKGEIISGGEVDISSSFVSPTIVRLSSTQAKDDILMEDEIFGPILPIIPFSSMSSVISTLQSKPIPLCLYVFTQNKNTADEVIRNTRSGSVAVNETMYQIGVPNGFIAGVGESGMGGYGLDTGFYTFTHPRVVLYANSATSKTMRITNVKAMYERKVGKFILMASSGVDVLPKPVKIAWGITRKLLGCTCQVVKAVVLVRVLEKVGGLMNRHNSEE